MVLKLLNGDRVWFHCVVLCRFEVPFQPSPLPLFPSSPSLCPSLSPQSQEKEAHDEMKRRAKELQLAKKEAMKRGGKVYNVGGGFGSSDYNPGPSVDVMPSHQPSKPAYKQPR